MPLELVNVDHENGTVGVTFTWDPNIQNLANYYVRWVPVVGELIQLGRAIAQLSPELEVKWPTGMEFWWANQSFAPIPATQAHPILGNKWISMSLEINHSLLSVTATPVVVITIVDNPRAFWQPTSTGRGGLIAYWLCRPADFLAILFLLIRFTEIEVTANNDLWLATRKEFPGATPFPKWRLRF